MNAKQLLWGLSLCLFNIVGCKNNNAVHRENGWYHILDDKQDSLSKEPIVTVKDFTALRLESDSLGNLTITGSLSKFKQNKWASATELSIGKRIGFLFEGKIIASPQVNMRIENGNFQISNPHGYDLQKIYKAIRQEKIDSIQVLFKGWEKDPTLYASEEKADSMLIAMDYWIIHEWMDISTNPEDHYWWGNLDSNTYIQLETSLHQELDKANVSSCPYDYMKSDAYKSYKAYLCENPDYINLMFQGFLFTEPSAGLCGWLVDDIVQSRYPEAPSLQKMAAETDNQDDEMFVKLKYQKAVWKLMNQEQAAIK